MTMETPISEIINGILRFPSLNGLETRASPLGLSPEGNLYSQSDHISTIMFKRLPESGYLNFIIQTIYDHFWSFLTIESPWWLGKSHHFLKPSVFFTILRIPHLRKNHPHNHIIGCFHQWGVPPNGWLMGENSISIDDLGGPPWLRKPPNHLF